jgi:dTMP kinase
MSLEALVHPGLEPDVTFLFDIDPATAQQRQRAQGRAPDAFESRQLDYFIRVRNAYLERQKRHSARMHLVDASGSVAQVRASLAERCAEVLA